MVTCEDPEKRAGVDYLVVWCVNEGVFNDSDRVTDHWAKFETWREADHHYNELLKAGAVTSASIVVPVKSTDYECSYADGLDDCATDLRYWQCDCEEHNIKDKHVVLHCDECGMDEDEQPDARLTDIVDLFHSISRRIEDQDRLDRHLGSPLENFLRVNWDGGIGGGR